MKVKHFLTKCCWLILANILSRNGKKSYALLGKGVLNYIFLGIPVTNKKVDINGVTLVRLQQGKLQKKEIFLTRDSCNNLDLS